MSRRIRRGWQRTDGSPMRMALIVVAICHLAYAIGLAAQPRVLDDFSSVSAWSAQPSDGVTLRISTDSGYRGRAMRLDFDFHGGGGYAIARRVVGIKLPANHEFSFRIRGEARPNDLEFKLVDATGDNVWWRNSRNFEFPRQWRPVTIRKRHIEFAWGPKGGGEMDSVAAIEIVITAGNGGKGTVWIDELTFTPREAVTAYTLTPAVRASSSARDADPARVIDGDQSTAWRSDAGGERQWIALDFLRAREYGGLTIDWDTLDYATSYLVQTSSDGA